MGVTLAVALLWGCGGSDDDDAASATQAVIACASRSTP